MRLPCEMIQDLMPLYEEGLCSAATHTAVEEHFQDCEQCRKQAEQMQKFTAYDIEEKHDPATEEVAMVKSLRKIHRRWRQSLVCVLLILPILFLSINSIFLYNSVNSSLGTLLS